MANSRVYRWECVDLEEGIGNTGTRARGDFLSLVSQWGRHAREAFGARLAGSWIEVGITGTWPRCVLLWEHEDLRALGAYADATDDHRLEAAAPSMREWMESAAKLRTEVAAKLLHPAAWSPTLDELLAAKVSGTVYYQQTVAVAPGSADEYLELLYTRGLPMADAQGLRLVGAWRTGLRHDSEVVVLWALRDFSHWSALEHAAHGGEMTAWRDAVRHIARDWENVLLVPGPDTPLNTGRIP